MKEINLIIGNIYGYTRHYNKFEVIGLYGGDYAWIKWINNSEIDTMHLTPINIENIFKV